MIRFAPTGRRRLRQLPVPGGPAIRPLAAHVALLLGAVGLLSPGAVHAHADEPPTPHDLWASWSTDPWVIVPLAVFLILYGAGFWKLLRVSRIRARHRRRLLALVGALASLFAALISPLDALGESLFSAHMAQHTILMLPAAWLLIAAKPLPLVLLGLPASVRRMVTGRTGRSGAFRRTGAWLVRPWPAAIIQTVTLWSWHAPVLFEAALMNDGIHSLMHISFVVAAILFWWSVAATDFRQGSGPFAVLGPVIFTAKLSLILGMLVLLSPWPWYAEHYGDTAAAWGTTVLQDQRLAAVIMLVPGLITYLATAIALLVKWVHREDERGRTRRVGLSGHSAGTNGEPSWRVGG